MLPGSCPDSQSLLFNGQPACAFQLCLTLQGAWCGRSGAPDAAEVGFMQLLPCATHSMLIKGETIRAVEALLNGATGGGPKIMLITQFLETIKHIPSCSTSPCTLQKQSEVMEALLSGRRTASPTQR